MTIAIDNSHKLRYNTTVEVKEDDLLICNGVQEIVFGTDEIDLLISKLIDARIKLYHDYTNIHSR